MINFTFNLQLHGGKGGSTTTVQSPAPTAQELRLQDVQANYAEKTAPTALALQKMGSNMILYNPGVMPVNYTAMGNSAVNNAYNIQNQSANLGNNFNGLSALNNANTATGRELNNNLVNFNNANYATSNSLYSGLNSTNNANTALNNSMYSGLSNQSTNNLSTGTQSNNNLINNQNYLNNNNANSMSGLVNGLLPSAYADNQAYAINRGMNTSFGNMLADKASRGIINSSVTNSGIQGISDSVANALSQNYNQNMQTAANMQNQNASQQQTGQNSIQNLVNNQNSLNQQNYGNQSNVASNLSSLNQQGYANQANIVNNSNDYNQQIYGNSANLANNQIALNQQGLNNQSNIYDQLSNNINQQNGLLSQPMALANSAQNASIDIPAKLLALSQGQQADTSSLLNTLSSNRINDKTTTQKTEGSGLLGGLLSGIGSYYGAKG